MPQITAPGNLGSLETISEFVLEQASRAGLEKHDAYQLQLAVDELATNSIIHGYEENGLTGDVTILAELTDAELALTVEDASVPYDPRQRDVAKVEDTFDDPLHERPIGGLGVYFVMQAVDRFDYEYADGKNRNTLVVRRPGVASSPTTAAPQAQP
jgi:anti-sigma regulatory factor (Ser/Thr protein kinase)